MIFIFFNPLGTKVTVLGSYWLTLIVLAALGIFFYFKAMYITTLVITLILIGIANKGRMIIKLMKAKGTLYEMFLKEEI